MRSDSFYGIVHNRLLHSYVTCCRDLVEVVEMLEIQALKEPQVKLEIQDQ